MTESKQTKTKAKAKSIAELCTMIDKEYGDGSAIVGNAVIPVEAVPTGIASLDVALGVGGLPIGRIVELFGWESSGKTTLTLHAIESCQKHFFEKKNRHGVAAFIDAEHAFDRDWATKLGVKVDDIILSQPNSGEEAFDIAETMINSGLIDLIVVDSVAALTPKIELEGEMSDSSIGAQARMMSKGLRKLHAAAMTNEVIVIFINQLRQKIGVMYGSNETTPGGMALKFYSSVRMQINKGSLVKGTGDVVVGFEPTVKIIKNKVATPHTAAQFMICTGTDQMPIYGIDKMSALLTVAVSMGIVKVTGSWYNYKGNKIGNGKTTACNYLREHNSVAVEMRADIDVALKNRVKSMPAPTADHDEILDSNDGEDDS